ncbi:hypothetical protein [Methylomonas sp. MgM2]
MMRLSIEVTPEQHQRLKAIAALSGQSIKDYVLNRVLPDTETNDADEALRQIEAFLKPRLVEAENGVFSEKICGSILRRSLAGNAVKEEGKAPGIIAILHERMDMLTRLKDRLG